MLARTLAAVVVAAGAVGASSTAQADPGDGSSLWTGAVDHLWSTAGNWGTGASVPEPGDDLVFGAGAGSRSNVNDLPADASYRSLTLGQAGYRLSGNAIQTGLVDGQYAAGTSTVLLVLQNPAGLTLRTSGGILDLARNLVGSDQIVGAGDVVIDGGHVRFSHGHSYTSTTRVRSGLLEVDNGVQSPVELAGGTLGGNGFLGAGLATPSAPSVVDAGPPGAPGLLGSRSLTLSPDVTLHVDLDGPEPGFDHDQLAVSGSAAFDPRDAVLEVDPGHRPSVGDSYRIVRQASGSPIVSRFAGLTQGASLTAGPVTYTIAYRTAGVDLQVSSVAPTPTATVEVGDDTLTVGETTPVTITFDAPVTGFDLADLSATNGTLSVPTTSDGGRTWTATLTPAAATTAAANTLTLDLTGVRNGAGFAGFGSATSNAYAVDTARVVPARAPVIGGRPQVGGTLVAIAGPHAPVDVDLSYAWAVDGSPVGEDSPIYRPTRADLEQDVTVTVTASHPGLADAVTASDPTTAVGGSGRVRAWGSNFNGESSLPAALTRTEAVALAAGFNHSLALSASGQVRAWGTAAATAVPTEVAAATVTSIGAGANHSLVVLADGSVRAWGRDASGQSTVPPSLRGRPVVAVGGGSESSLALTADGDVVPWGTPDHGLTTVPAALDDRDVVAIAAGSAHDLALTSDGQVVAWGLDADGQVDVPAALEDETVVAVAAGAAHSLALTADGRVVAWGDPSNGRTSVPTAIQGQVVAIASGPGSATSFALLRDGTVAGWGASANQLLPPPGALVGTPNVTVAGGGTHALALTSAVVTSGPPEIVGTPRVGAELVLQLPSYSVEPDLSVRWFADGRPVAGTDDDPTFTPTAQQEGTVISATVTAARTSHLSHVESASGVGPVGAGLFTTGPTAGIQGTPVVGETLTATTGAPAPAADSYAYAWSADGDLIDGATTGSLTLTPDLADALLTVTVTARRAGYDDASDESDPVEVGEATFTSGPTAGITGTAVVDGTVVASVGSASPAPSSYRYAWFADGVEITDNSSPEPQALNLTAAHAGRDITVEVTARRDGYVDASDVSDPVEVAQARFVTGPTASISGTAQVGRTLTAGTGQPDPAPASYRYQWLADGAAVTGATGADLVLTPALRGRRVAVEVTAVRPGYDDATDRSATTVPVVTGRAPAVTLRVRVAASASGGQTADGTPSVVLGRRATVAWTSTGASRLVAGGALAEAVAERYPSGVPAAGRVRVRLTRAGLHGIRMVATNELASTTAYAAVTAVRPPKRLDLTVPGTARAGGELRLRVAGLGGHERFVVLAKRRGGGPEEQLATGRASGSGTVARRVALPDRAGKVRIRVIGRSTLRTATVTVRLR